MAPQYKLTYFDVQGSAELTRLVFAAAGQDFIDERIDRAKLEEIKPTLPFGQVPVLHVDGQIFAQSAAIANFVAKEFGLFGKSNLEAIQIDQVTCHLQDFKPHFRKVFFMENEPAVKETLLQEMKDTTIPKFFKPLENLLEKNKTGFFVGSEISLADIAVFSFGDMLIKKNVLDLNDFPKVKANTAKVTSHPKIAQYLKMRKP